MFSKLKKFYHYLVDAIFPRHCVLCEKVEGVVLCQACRSTWSPTVPELAQSRFASFFYADPIVRSLICDWKFSFDKSSRDELFRQLKTRLGPIKQMVRNERVDVVCCIPLHAIKRRVRGFDQAEEISRFVAKRTQRSFLPLLLRIRPTTSQADKKKTERDQIVINNPFAINPAFNVPRRVLLVDDVWTSGSTIKAASEVLMRAGVEKIIVYTVAQGVNE